MSVRPTRRLLGIVVAAGIVYVGGMNSLLVWLYAVCAMLLALLPIGIAGPPLVARGFGAPRVAAVRRRGFDAPLAVDAARIFEGDDAVIHLGNRWRAERFDMLTVIAADGARLPATLEYESDATCLCVHLRSRGPITFERIEMVSSWPFGLMIATRRRDFVLPLLVHPRYWIVDAERGTGAGIGGEDPTRKGTADDVVGLREYRSGDSRRQIHWMTTARQGRLMVVERAAPTFAALQARLRLEPGAAPEACDLAVRVTATLVASCTHLGRPFRLTLPDGPPEARRWNEAIARLARATSQASPPGRAVSAAIRAEGSRVTVESESGTVALEPGASLDQIAAVVRNLL